MTDAELTARVVAARRHITQVDTVKRQLIWSVHREEIVKVTALPREVIIDALVMLDGDWDALNRLWTRFKRNGEPHVDHIDFNGEEFRHYVWLQTRERRRW
jgi:hypothetical protein